MNRVVTTVAVAAAVSVAASAAYAQSGSVANAVAGYSWADAAKEADERKTPEGETARMQTDHEQLKKELESYHQHKPVRERQTAADAPDATPTADHALSPSAAPAPAQV